MLDEREFSSRCQDAMERLFRDLSRAADRHDFEVDQNAGAITLEFESPRARFVVSPNGPARQIWVSALVKSFKLDWDAARGEFVFPETGASLHQLMSSLISRQTGEAVDL